MIGVGSALGLKIRRTHLVERLLEVSGHFYPKRPKILCKPNVVIFVSVAPEGKHVMIHRAQSRYAHFHHLTLFRAASVSLFPRLSLVQALPSLSPALLRSVTFRSQGMLHLETAGWAPVHSVENPRQETCTVDCG